jgi:predicted ArsR family transcriptional regulator
VLRAQARLAGNPLARQVAELASILSADGYMAEWQKADDGAWTIIEHNCAILDVAVRYRLACRSELSFIREVLPSASVERVQHIVSGGHVCAYRITEDPASEDTAET